MNRVVLCTHASLVRLPPAAFKNVLIVIDEAHHVKHESHDIGNRLGALVKHSLNSSNGIRLGLATATWMRGDKIKIVPDLSRFTRFDLAYDDFLATCEHLRSFSYDFIISANYSTSLKDLFDKRTGKTIVYIPYVNSRYSLGTKDADVQAVLRAIAGCDDPDVENESGPTRNHSSPRFTLGR